MKNYNLLLKQKLIGRILSYLLFFQLFSFSGFAQFEKGSITLPNGEEVNGYIRLDGQIDLQDQIYFKVLPDQSEAQAYGPQSLQSFRFDQGDVYHQIQVSYEEDNRLLSKKRFVKMMASGTIDLYLEMKSLQRGNFVFYARKAGTLHRLTEEPVLLPSGNYTLPNPYKGVLKVLTFDCSELKEVEKVPFRIEALTDLINAYNLCRNANYQPLITKYKEKTEKQLFGEALVGINFLQARDDPPLSSTGNELKGIYGHSGLALQIGSLNPAFSRKLITQYGIGFYQWFYLGAPREEINESFPTSTIAINLSAHHLFNPFAKIKWYSRLGGNINFDLGVEVPLRPSFSIGFGAYLPSGTRLGLQYESILIIKGIVAWEAVVAMPLLKK